MYVIHLKIYPKSMCERCSNFAKKRKRSDKQNTKRDITQTRNFKYIQSHKLKNTHKKAWRMKENMCTTNMSEVTLLLAEIALAPSFNPRALINT